MVRTLCLLLLLTAQNTLLAEEDIPDPAFLELLGIALDVKPLGIDVDKLIEERLEVDENKQEASDKQ